MTDRGLLELAAKAAGYDTSHRMNAQRLLLDPPVISLWITKGGELSHTAWNPLDDNSDAFRLAVDLKINIEFESDGEGEGVWANGTKVFVNSNSIKGDRRQSAREAIVLVASEIGRAMP